VATNMDRGEYIKSKQNWKCMIAQIS
jgi:hypothetical protein